MTKEKFVRSDSISSTKENTPRKELIESMTKLRGLLKDTCSEQPILSEQAKKLALSTGRQR